MLALTRQTGEEICIGSDIRIQVVEVENNRVYLGIQAPAHIRVDRQEVNLRREQNEAEARAW